MTIKRMDHVGVVVDDLEAATAFFLELGMTEVGRAPIAGPWVDGVSGMTDVHAEIVFLRTPDGHGQLELTTYTHPVATTAEPSAPPNTIGLRNLMFAVEDLDDTVARLKPHGAELIGRIEQYETAHRLCYLRGPAGIIIALAEDLD
ncbi:VOC family protein [Kribbella hippodromi]|uniref:VOC family protein n=1 Tax=Kribbella hippodromi TaxID=434347 RepID=A0ABN2CUC4_9ACTN